MSRFLKERYRELAPYTPGEQPQNRRYIKLNTNESPYPPSPRVLEAILGRLPEGWREKGSPEESGLKMGSPEENGLKMGSPEENGLKMGRSEESGLKMGSPEESGGAQMRQAFIERRQADSFGEEIGKLRLYSDPEARDFCQAVAQYYGVEPDQVMGGNGSDEILAFAFLAFGGDKASVRFPAISYGFYPVFAQLFGLAAEPVPLTADFRVDPRDYAACGKDTLIVIANPNAPTGICLSLQEIEGILRGNSDNLVIIDEAYVDFGGETVIPLIEKYDNLMVVQTFSKSRSLAGARLGFAVSSKEIIGDMNKMKFSFNPYNINRLSLLAGAAAIRDREYFQQCVTAIAATRERTAESMRRLGFTVLPSKANFIFAKSEAIKGREYFKKLREKGILVRRWDKPSIEDFVRITIGTAEEMEAFIKATEEILREEHRG